MLVFELVQFAFSIFFKKRRRCDTKSFSQVGRSRYDYLLQARMLVERDYSQPGRLRYGFRSDKSASLNTVRALARTDHPVSWRCHPSVEGMELVVLNDVLDGFELVVDCSFYGLTALRFVKPYK